jgi:hypothetical protein
MIRLIERSYRTFTSAWYQSEIIQPDRKINQFDRQIQKQRLLIHRANRAIFRSKLARRSPHEPHGKSHSPPRKDS